jgi:hypothetical protein
MDMEYLFSTKDAELYWNYFKYKGMQIMKAKN